jgi:Reverse transcriptase (RNA-dependent DNA polymerase)
MISFTDFRRIFGSSFWKTLNDSLVPYESGQKPTSKDEFLKQLYKDILDYNYSPSIPRGYIVQDKHRRVARIVPTFTYRENCVYFFCIKSLEDAIAINRVEGTFGGWRLGNPLRKQEEAEGEYNPIVSYDPGAWSKHWREFQKKAYEFSNSGNYQYFIKVDIANFYDSINLTLLENKIRTVIDNEQRFIVDLLFNFLGNWNKKFEGYTRKTVGIPQDEITDSSRILANFFLQDYDAFMLGLCNESGCRYLRYADDQIICAPDQFSARELLFEASRELAKINLNLNSSKVHEFASKREFELYWAFDLFRLLEDPDHSYNINQAATQLISRWSQGDFFRWESVLKRLLSVGFGNLAPHTRHELLARIYDPDFLSQASHWYMKRISDVSQDKEEFYSILDNLVDKVRYNSFHYNLLRFNKRHRRGHSNEKLLKKIDDLKFK